MLEIHGVPFSAHTRKVIVGCLEKGLDYELSRLVPLAKNLPQWFLEASPLRRIPVLGHEGRHITDSTVIALYLDRAFPERPLYPKSPAAYARALFVEELVDGALAEHVLHGVLLQRVFGPLFLGITPDDALIERSLTERIPPRLDDLEKRLEGDWFAGEFSYADITVASILMNFHYAGETLDRERTPKLHEFFRRALRRDSFLKALETEVLAAKDIRGFATEWLDGVLG